jgi:predicted ester cyclase
VSGTQNTATMVRLVDEVCNEGRLAVLEAIMSANCTHHDGNLRLPSRGPEAAGERVRLVRSAFPDLHVLIDDLVAEADRTVVRWSACGTHVGLTPGIAATGKWAQVTGITIARFTEG